MDFGKAVNICKAGRSIRRRGWNGKDQFIYYVKPNNYAPTSKIAREAFEGRDVPYRAYLAIKTVQGDVVPWVASQSDLLADDWECYFKKAVQPKTEFKPEPWKDFNPFPWFKDGYLTPSSPITCSSNKDHQLDAFSYGLSLLAKPEPKPTREELQKKVMDELVGKIADKGYVLNSSESSLAGKLLGIVTQKKGIGFPVPPDEAYTSYNSLIDWMNVNVQAID